jgi:hypothetical protein
LIGLQALFQIHSQEASVVRNMPLCGKSWVSNSVSLVLQVGDAYLAAEPLNQHLRNGFSGSKKTRC